MDFARGWSYHREGLSPVQLKVNTDKSQSSNTNYPAHKDIKCKHDGLPLETDGSWSLHLGTVLVQGRRILKRRRKEYTAKQKG